MAIQLPVPILSRNIDDKNRIWEVMKLLGSNTNAWDAWLVHNGLKTLKLRMDKHCSNATKIAHFLESHHKVTKVNYPGLETNMDHNIAKKQMSQFGAMLSFEIEGGLEESKKFMNDTRLCTISSTLGNIDTLLLHPVSSSHLNVPEEIRAQFGITDGLIRVSVGIENVDDLISDMDQVLG